MGKTCLASRRQGKAWKLCCNCHALSCNEGVFLYIIEINICKSTVPIGLRFLKLSCRWSVRSSEECGLQCGQLWWSVGCHHNSQQSAWSLVSLFISSSDEPYREKVSLTYIVVLSQYWSVFTHHHFCSHGSQEWNEIWDRGDVSTSWGDLWELAGRFHAPDSRLRHQWGRRLRSHFCTVLHVVCSSGRPVWRR